MSHNCIEIRRSNESDFEQLMEIDNCVWGPHNTPADTHWNTIEQYAEHYPAGSQIVAVRDGNVVGYLGFRPSLPIPSHSHVAELMIAVHPECHGQGIGRKLINAAEDWCRENGKKKLCLRVMGTNHGAIELYKRCGFREQGRLVNEFFRDGQYIDDVMMFKWLEEQRLLPMP